MVTHDEAFAALVTPITWYLGGDGRRIDDGMQ
jgi:hypothetical protein